MLPSRLLPPSLALRPTPSLPRLVALGLLVLGLLVSVWAPVPAAAEEPAGEAQTLDVPVERFLLLGPVPAPLPAFHDVEGPGGEAVAAADLLGESFLEVPEIWPAAGDTVTWVGGRELGWSEAAAPVELPRPADAPAVAHLAAYVEVDRFVSATLEVTTPHLVRVLVDGEEVAKKAEVDAVPPEGSEAGNASEPGSASGEVALRPGKHLLWIEHVLHPDGPAEASLAARLEIRLGEEAADGSAASGEALEDEGGEDGQVGGGEARRPRVSVGVSPERAVTISDLLDVDTLGELRVSADGGLVAVTVQTTAVPAEHRRSRLEILRTEDGSVVRSFRGTPQITGFAWGPAKLYAYATEKDEKTTVWVGDLATGSLRPLLEEVERLGSFRFTPDGAHLLYTLSVEPEEDDRGAQRMESLQDRWTGFRTKSFLHAVTVEDGVRRRLTAGGISTELQDVSADGSRVLFARSRYTAERPFSVGELWELELGGDDLAPRLVAEVTWLGGARYSPDGETLLVSAGPSAFEGLGVAEEVGALGRIPNDYDSQLYLVDCSDGEARPLTRHFDPSVHDAAWSHADGHIYLTAEEGSFVRLYRLSIEGAAEAGAAGEISFEQLDTGVDAVEAFSLAADAPVLAFRGSSVTAPERLFALEVDSADPGPRGLMAPAGERYAQVRFGRVEDWDVEVPSGAAPGGTAKLQGRVYYPPGFDASKTYPLFVYYYGGTAPTGRQFGGRYPKNWWAANGYVVYVLQPSGATGFGQEFSSRHVNDWGQVVAQEIIAAVEAFTDAHPFVDTDAIGCHGGSYGGFMTMLLLSESRLFDAGVAHAGISSISSYWGEGWWGYLYSAVATAESYPWNRPEIYVDQSPLFQADRIRDPLLLIHGTADPNVPPGESEQMFTALSVLGREVEYVKIEGEAHWILDYPKRVLWWESIVAFLDKHLKGQPEWWEHLWER